MTRFLSFRFTHHISTVVLALFIRTTLGLSLGLGALGLPNQMAMPVAAGELSPYIMALPETSTHNPNEFSRLAAANASIVVNDAGDVPANDSKCTLREAIINANRNNQSGSTDCAAGSGADTITFAPSLIGSSIVLTGGALPLTSAITIDGAGVISVSGNRISNVFSVNNTGVVTLTGLTIRDGLELFGAGITNTGGIMAINNVTFTQNASFFSGGGLFNNGGIVTVTNSSFLKNEAALGNGGGLQNYGGVMSVNNSEFIGQVATYGGGIGNALGTMTVTNSNVWNNKSYYGGAGIVNSVSGTMYITNTAIFSNVATGGIIARSGGGIFNVDHAKLTIANSSITSNTVEDVGGAIINTDHGVMTVTNTSIVSNTALDEAGGIYNVDQSVLNLVDSTVRQNYAVNHYGGIINTAASMTISNSNVLSNSTPGDGGGVANHSGGGLTVNNSLIAYNSAQSEGGGIFNIFSVLNVNNSRVVSNTAQLGAGLFHQQSSGAYLSNTTVGYNIASDRGGAIFSVLSTLSVTNSSLISNTAQTGGALHNDRSSSQLTNNCIVNNSNVAVRWVNGAAVAAPNNWWGNPSGPSGAGPGIGDSISANVSFAPPLAATIFGCPTWGPELGVSKQVQPPQSVQGQPVTYTIPFSNSGNFTATKVVITDVVPISITISGVTSSTYGAGVQITQTSGGPTFTWAISDLLVGSGGILTLTGVITSDLRVIGRYLTNTVTSDTLGEVQPSNNTVSASVWVTNIMPIANAGANQSVGVSSTVTLNGSASNDPDGHTPLSYRWAQVGGPAVSLSNVAATSPNFTAPVTPTVLTFTLMVTDATGLGASSAATTVVTVTDIAITGLVALNSSPTFIGKTTYLTASISAGSNVTYVWAFGDGQSGSGAMVTHTYAAVGVYTAVVTATNGLNQLTATTVVRIVNPPASSNEPPYKPPEPLPPNEDEADIGMQDGGSLPAAAPNDLITLVFVVSLTGERNGTSVFFVDVLPEGLAFDSVNLQPPGGTCVFIAESGRVECQLGIVTQDRPVTVTLRVRATRPGRFVNTAQAIGLDTRIIDMPGNNTVQNIIVVSPAGAGQGDSAVQLGSGFGTFVLCRAEGVCVLRWATEGAQNIVRYELVREPLNVSAALLRGGPSIRNISPKEIDGRASYEVIDSDVLAGHTYDYTVRGVGANGAIHLLQSQRVTVPIRVYLSLVRGR